jgi:hypothetical protein
MHPHKKIFKYTQTLILYTLTQNHSKVISYHNNAMIT